MRDRTIGPEAQSGLRSYRTSGGAPNIWEKLNNSNPGIEEELRSTSNAKPQKVMASTQKMGEYPNCDRDLEEVS